MGAVDEFWSQGVGALRSNFERARATQTDSGIKGGANERILGSFLSESVGAQRIAVKSSIIDSGGRRSDEVDVSILNEYQPFWTGDSEQLLIAEGVDAVYQSKAILSKHELRRAITNARSVKKLIRQAGKGSQTFAVQADVSRFVNRIPYFVFGYTTEVSKDAALGLLNDELADTPHEDRPDGVFLLGGWSLVNIGNNDGAFTADVPPGTSGFVSMGGRSSLAWMMWCHHIFVPRIVHLMHPIRHYHRVDPS